MNYKKIILYIVIFIICLSFIYWISHIKHINLTSGHQPFTSISSGVIYDGDNIWIANTYQNSISKFTLATTTPSSINLLTKFTSGAPLQLLSVGAYIWASDYESGYVNKINKDSGSIEASIIVGSAPMGMAFDGTNIWVCNYGSSSCSVISQSSNTVIETIKVGSGPTCVLFDGTNIWISSSLSGNVYISDPTSLQLVTTLTVGKNPYRMTTMGGYVYVLDVSDSSVYKLNTETILEQLTQQSFVKCNDIVNDGTYLYISSLDSNVYKLSVNNVMPSSFGSGLNSIDYIQLIKDIVIVIYTQQFEIYNKDRFRFISSGNI